MCTKKWTIIFINIAVSLVANMVASLNVNRPMDDGWSGHIMGGYSGQRNAARPEGEVRSVADMRGKFNRK